MKIVTLLPDENVRSDLQTLAANDNRVIARMGEKLLELVVYLESDGPAPSAFAQLHLSREIWLSPVNEYNRATVRISIDWPDYGPLIDGLPRMHYRLQICRRPGKPTRDARSDDVAEAGRLIMEAFGWSRTSDDGAS